MQTPSCITTGSRRKREACCAPSFIPTSVLPSFAPILFSTLDCAYRGKGALLGLSPSGQCTSLTPSSSIVPVRRLADGARMGRPSLLVHACLRHAPRVGSPFSSLLYPQHLSQSNMTLKPNRVVSSPLLSPSTCWRSVASGTASRRRRRDGRWTYAISTFSSECYGCLLRVVPSIPTRWSMRTARV